MMLPILISVSVAPVSYFFWASAPPEVAANAMTAVENAAILSSCLESILSPHFYHLGLQDGLSACETPRTASVRFDGYCGIYHRARIRATRWLNPMIPVSFS